MRLAPEHLVADHVYLIPTMYHILVYIGAGVGPQTLMELTGTA